MFGSGRAAVVVCKLAAMTGGAVSDALAGGGAPVRQWSLADAPAGEVALTVGAADLTAPRPIAYGDFAVSISACFEAPGPAALELWVGADGFLVDGAAGRLTCFSATGIRTFLDQPLNAALPGLEPGAVFSLAVARDADALRVVWNGTTVYAADYARDTVGRVRVRMRTGRAAVKAFAVEGLLPDLPEAAPLFWKGLEESAYYRIPALLALRNGVLLAFAEARREGVRDTGNIDLVYRRSTDGGRTWGPVVLLYEEGGEARITCTNLSPVYDRETGRLWAFFLVCARWNAGDFKLMRMVSDDEGGTWSEPEDIRTRVGRADWLSAHPGPGHGIQLAAGPHAGRLMVPGWSYRKDGHRVFVLYSDDHGDTWRCHEPVAVGPNETMLVERSGGGVTAMMRQPQRSTSPWRLFTTSFDGVCWEPVRRIQAFRSVVCQASVLAAGRASDGGPRAILFCHPGSGNYSDPDVHRAGLTLRTSLDDGFTWPVAELLYPGRCAYSDMARLPDGRVGILFENGDADTYARISFLAWTPCCFKPDS